MVHVALISPHPDDIALSLGGCIARFHKEVVKDAAMLTLLRVFSRSLYAPYQREAVSEEAIFAVRKEEDEDYCARYGIHTMDLGFGDSSTLGMDEMQERIASIETDPRREAVLDALQAALTRLSADILVCPATIGNHIDHRLVASAVQTGLGHGGFRIIYEDTPYLARATDEEVVETVQSVWGFSFTPIVCDITEYFPQKLNDLSLYGSQLGDAELQDVVDSSSRYCLGCKTERLWIEKPLMLDLRPSGNEL